MALPNTGISVSMVKSAIGASTNDVGSLCSHPNINKWSRWKPIRRNKLDGITLSDIATVRGGLQFVEFDTLAALVTYYRNNPSYSFEYLKPRGGAQNEFYRLGDFRNYDHTAFRWYIVGGKREIYFSSDPVAQLFLQTEGININYNLGWESVSMNDHYYGAMIVPQGTTGNIQVGLSTIPFSNTSVNAYIGDVPILGLTDGTYEVYSFIYRNIPGSPPTPKYIPIDGGYMGTAQVRSSRLNMTGGGTIKSQAPGYTVNWNLLYENVDTSSETVNGVVVAARYINSAPWSPLVAGEVSESLGNISVPSLQTVSRSGTFMNCLINLPSNGNAAYLQVDNTSDASLRRTISLTWTS